MKFRLKLFLAFVLFSIFVTFFSIYSFSTIVESKGLHKQIKVIQSVIDEKDKKLNAYMDNMSEYLHAIANNKDFRKYQKDKTHKENVIDLFDTILNSRHCLMQIRYIDNNGDEQIRVDLSNNNKLQNKKQRYYFKQIQKESVGSIWFSKFDLNVENKKIQRPIKEVIRIGLKLQEGILVINISLMEIKNILKMHDHNTLLVDKNGDILVDSSGQYSWSKYLKKDLKIDDILGVDDLEFLSKEYFSTDKFISKKLTFKNGDEAVIVLPFDISLSEHISKDMFAIYIMIGILTIIISIILAYAFSKPMARLSSQMEKANRTLDKKVERRTNQLKKSLNIIDKYVIRSSTDLEGNIVYVSDAFCKISGYSKSELLGKPHSIVRHPDMPKEVFKNMWETIQSGKTWNGILKNKTKKGDFYWVEANIEPKFNDQGNIIAYTAIRNNITSNVLLEELNKSLNERIKHEVERNTRQFENMQKEQLKTAKLSSIGALAAGITHEINTPLTYIKGNFELMKFDIEDIKQEEIKYRLLDNTTSIMDGISRITNIVEAMREVSQNSTEQKKIENIYSTIITALTISFNTSKQITKVYLNGELFNIDMDKDKYIYNVKVQRQRIEQVWIVIIRNALDELFKIEDYEQRRLDIDIYNKQNKFIVKFKDNAGGIDDSIIDNVFEPFISSKQQGGIGIGLNIAKKIVEDQNGTIKAYNEDKCAVFEIELEMAKEN